jgi:hypothetical protein
MSSDLQPASQVYNWHPAVHARFGETLYFFLLRVKRHYCGSVPDQVESILAGAGVAAACEYTLYGHWDALIRVWLTSASRRRLLEELDKPESNVEEAPDYTVTQIRYLWSDKKDDLMSESRKMRPNVTERFGDIKTAVEEFDRMLAPQLIQRLTRANLLVERPEATGDDPVKFYLCLQTDPNLGQIAARNRILKALEAAEMTDRSTLYTGNGSFANYLVRCVADTYSEILQLTAALDENLDGLDVRPMTLLVADRNTHESDNVNDTSALSPEDENSLDLLDLSDPEVRELLKRLTAAQRESLHGLVRLAYEHSEEDDQLRQQLRDLLRASCRNDHPGVAAASAFMIEFEWFFGEYLKRTWGLLYGSDWMDHLATIFAEKHPKKDWARRVSDPDTWSLGLCVNMAISLADADPRLEARFAQQVGTRWKSQMLVSKDLRNKVAHGKLRKENLNEFSGEWGKLLGELMAVAALHYKIERMMDDGGNDDH